MSEELRLLDDLLNMPIVWNVQRERKSCASFFLEREIFNNSSEFQTKHASTKDE